MWVLQFCFSLWNSRGSEILAYLLTKNIRLTHFHKCLQSTRLLGTETEQCTVHSRAGSMSVKWVLNLLWVVLNDKDDHPLYLLGSNVFSPQESGCCPHSKSLNWGCLGLLSGSISNKRDKSTFIKCRSELLEFPRLLFAGSHLRGYQPGWFWVAISKMKKKKKKSIMTWNN